MSCCWGYHCRTHEASSEHIVNHGDEDLNNLWKARRYIQKARELMGPISELRIECCGYGDTTSFLFEHINCDLCLEDEYGRTKELEGT